MTNKKVILIYTGGGFGGTWQGIPARNLTSKEVDLYGGIDAILDTGLYEKPNRNEKKSIEELEDGE
jgi:hypothetical protein